MPWVRHMLRSFAASASPERSAGRSKSIACHGTETAAQYMLEFERYPRRTKIYGTLPICHATRSHSRTRLQHLLLADAHVHLADGPYASEHGEEAGEDGERLAQRRGHGVVVRDDQRLVAGLVVEVERGERDGGAAERVHERAVRRRGVGRQRDGGREPDISACTCQQACMHAEGAGRAHEAPSGRMTRTTTFS